MVPLVRVGLAMLLLVGCASVPRRLARGRVEDACELARDATGDERDAWLRHVAPAHVVVAVEPLDAQALEARFGLSPRGEGSHLLRVRWALDALPEGTTSADLTLRLSALGQTAGARLTDGVGGDLREVFAPPRLVLQEVAPYEPAPFEPPPRPTLERRGTPGRPHGLERLANELLSAFSLGIFRADDEALPPLTPESSAALGVWLDEVRRARAAYEAAETERRAAHEARARAAEEANAATRRAHLLAVDAYHEALAALSVELAMPRCEGDVEHGLRCEGYAVWSAPPSEPEALALWAQLELGFGLCRWRLVGRVLGEPGATWEAALAATAPTPVAIDLGSVH